MLNALRLTARLVLAAVLAVIGYATVVPISLRPNSGHLHLERVLAYFALGGAMAVAFPRRPMWTLAAVLGIACGLEAIQTFIPTRDGRLSDAMEKSAGGLGGIVSGWIFTGLTDLVFPDGTQRNPPPRTRPNA